MQGICDVVVGHIVISREERKKGLLKGKKNIEQVTICLELYGSTMKKQPKPNFCVCGEVFH